MAMFPHTTCVASKFICPQEQDGGVREKRNHLHTPRIWNNAPHVDVAAYVGTEPDALNVTSAHFYSQHVPEAPCLLGADRTATYAAGAAATRFAGPTGQRTKAVCLAALVGGGLGVVGGLVGWAACGLAVALGFVSAAVPAAVALNICCVYFVLGAAFGLGMEWRDWAQATKKLGQLHTLSQGFDQLTQGTFNQASIDACQVVVAQAYQGKGWALRHAALEYEAELRHRREQQGPVPAKVAA